MQVAQLHLAEKQFVVRCDATLRKKASTQSDYCQKKQFQGFELFTGRTRIPRDPETSETGSQMGSQTGSRASGSQMSSQTGSQMGSRIRAGQNISICGSHLGSQMSSNFNLWIPSGIPNELQFQFVAPNFDPTPGSHSNIPNCNTGTR